MVNYPRKETKVQSVKNIVRTTHLLDAEGQILGRLAVIAAKHLLGKDKPTFSPSVDGGDAVTIINARKIKFTGDKGRQKVYTRYSGYPGGITKETLDDLLARRPGAILRRAIMGMLPKNKLQRPRIRRLNIYAGGEK